MKRILVPLDGSPVGEAIIADAQELAGPDGELILIHDVKQHALHQWDDGSGRAAVEFAERYLETQVEELASLGVRVKAQTLTFDSVSAGIDRAAEAFQVDATACATHGRTPLGRLFHGGVAWSMLAHSRVPVMLRNVGDPTAVRESPSTPRSIMVPLDGSAYAEKALPLARTLADQWTVPITLVYIIPDLAADPQHYGRAAAFHLDHIPDTDAARAYLEEIARQLGGDVNIVVRTGAVVDCLVEVAHRPGISHVVMASHGRTALARVIIGSVADALLQTLHRPVIVVPALAAARVTPPRIAAART